MRYVVVYAKPINNLDSILVIKKNRPEWQAGMYNLPGGKIEDGESPEQAAIRELEEEAGLKPLFDCEDKPYVDVMGSIKGDWGVVECVKILVQHALPTPRDCETELPIWLPWHDIRNSEKLIPNLRVIIPMMMAGVTDWTVLDEGPSWKATTHEIAVHVKSHVRQ